MRHNIAYFAVENKCFSQGSYHFCNTDSEQEFISLCNHIKPNFSMEQCFLIATDLVNWHLQEKNIETFEVKLFENSCEESGGCENCNKAWIEYRDWASQI